MAEPNPMKTDNAEQHNTSLKLPQVFDSNYKDFTIVHTFNAPKEMLFKMFTKSEHFKNWFGPYSCTIPSCEIDLRPGGKISLIMITANGFTNPLEGIFYEIIENKKLIFSARGFKGPDNESKIEFLNFVTFDDYNGKTKLTLVSKVIKAEVKEPGMAVQGMMDGWPQAFDKLDSYLKNQ